MPSTARLHRRPGAPLPNGAHSASVSYILLNWSGPWSPEDVESSDHVCIEVQSEEVSLDGGRTLLHGPHWVLSPLIDGPVWLLDVAVRNALREAGADVVTIEGYAGGAAKCGECDAAERVRVAS